MNKIGSKALYAVATMYVLSNAVNQRPMRSVEIAAMTSISHNYLEQILSALRKASLIHSTRGSKGGYKLARPADTISVLEIIEAVEGKLFKIDLNVGSSIILETFWKQVQEKLTDVFKIQLSEIDQCMYESFIYTI